MSVRAPFRLAANQCHAQVMLPHGIHGMAKKCCFVDSDLCPHKSRVDLLDLGQRQDDLSAVVDVVGLTRVTFEVDSGKIGQGCKLSVQR